MLLPMGFAVRLSWWDDRWLTFYRTGMWLRRIMWSGSRCNRRRED